jgi:hypothetical protein
VVDIRQQFGECDAFSIVGTSSRFRFAKRYDNDIDYERIFEYNFVNRIGLQARWPLRATMFRPCVKFERPQACALEMRCRSVFDVKSTRHKSKC